MKKQNLVGENLVGFENVINLKDYDIYGKKISQKIKDEGPYTNQPNPFDAYKSIVLALRAALGFSPRKNPPSTDSPDL